MRCCPTGSTASERLIIESRATLAGAGLARLRQACYRLLASGYRPPSADGAEEVFLGMEALEDMGLGQFAFAAAVRRWVSALADADWAAAGEEQVRLFGSGMDGAVCPPIESQCLGDNRAGDPARYAARLERLMRRAGLAVRHPEWPPDHLLVELELGSALCRGEAEAREADADAATWLEQEQELVGVMTDWVPALAATVAERDRVGVLRALTRASADYVLHDHDVIRLLLEGGSP